MLTQFFVGVLIDMVDDEYVDGNRLNFLQFESKLLCEGVDDVRGGLYGSRSNACVRAWMPGSMPANARWIS